MADGKSAVLITGASSGIGAVYARKFAARGHDLVLVARNREKMDALAAQLRQQHKVEVDVLAADLTDRASLATVEARLRDDDRIGILINNAGAATMGPFDTSNAETNDNLIALNITAVTRLAGAVVPRMLREGRGAMINIASAVGLAPEFPFGIYGATKAYVLAFSQNMYMEFGARGLYVQAVLPAATRTEIWEKSGRDVNTIPGVMDVDEMVEAALVGFDRREAVTIPSLPDEELWTTFDTARKAMVPRFRNEHAAARYQKSA